MSNFTALILCLIHSLEQLKIGDILQDAFKLTADLPEIETQVCAHYSHVNTHYSHVNANRSR